MPPIAICLASALALSFTQANIPAVGRIIRIDLAERIGIDTGPRAWQ